jgi:hypothetical protein
MLKGYSGIFFSLIILLSTSVELQASGSIKIARLKYSGGGDWYASPTSLPNLIEFCNDKLNTNIHPREDVVEPGSSEIFNYPFIHMTGHGNVVFSDREAENLRNYLMAGGFLNINDSYGMDPYIRPAIQKIFPDKDLVELPFDHPIFHQTYAFPEGLPKIHEHDGKPPQGFGIFHEGRLVLFYIYESDIGDGWEDPEVHGDPEVIRQKALRMGANIIQYVFNQE